MVPSAETAAQTAALGFDFLWIEMEHSPITLETLRHMVLATRGLPALPLARVPVAEYWTAKRVLDSGALGVIFPFVNSPALAKTAAEACRYPPQGRRGSGAGLANFRWPVPSYYDFADENVLCVAMVERAEAVDAIDEIAATPGLDVIFIGVSDLSFSLGLRGRQDEPLLREAIAKVVASARKHGRSGWADPGLRSRKASINIIRRDSSFSRGRRTSTCSARASASCSSRPGATVRPVPRRKCFTEARPRMASASRGQKAPAIPRPPRDRFSPTRERRAPSARRSRDPVPPSQPPRSGERSAGRSHGLAEGAQRLVSAARLISPGSRSRQTR